MMKNILIAASVFSLLFLTSCQEGGGKAGQDAAMGAGVNTEVQAADWPPLAERLACLPEAGALIAAHRGTSKNEGLAENALGSLEALLKAGILITEIDVARLGSGEHILFHDGVWEDKSTGRGALASTRYAQAQTYLLKDNRGGVTSERPPLLAEYLRAAKGRAYVEIDFKSSANYEQVIDLIRAAGMERDVILIAYSKGQAAKLSRLAPKMALSVPVKKIGDIKAYRASGVKTQQIYGWIGGRVEQQGLPQQLMRAGIPILAKSQQPKSAGPASIIVSDYALQKTVFEGAIGLGRSERQSYKNCIYR
jgi:glycerophosphoryl diester phosphodiesterase